MFIKKMFRTFFDPLLECHPDFKENLLLNDQYPGLMHFLKNRHSNLPIFSFDTKAIINHRQIVEQV